MPHSLYSLHPNSSTDKPLPSSDCLSAEKSPVGHTGLFNPSEADKYQEQLSVQQKVIRSSKLKM
jgi:hypothetical protein